ncbi:MAG: hypothetical protein ACRDRH_22025 [Pseudonocardia sp.]
MTTPPRTTTTGRAAVSAAIRPPTAPVNDLDLIASVIRLAGDPGYVLIGPAQHVFSHHPTRTGWVDRVPAYEQDAVLQLIGTKHLTIGGTRHVHHGQHDGPARSVLVPKHARAMVRRWSALKPLR